MRTMTVTYNCTTWLYGNCQFTFLVTWFYRWIGALWSDLCFLHVGRDHIPNSSIRVSESRAAGRFWNFLFEWNKCIILAQHDMKWILPGWKESRRLPSRGPTTFIMPSFFFFYIFRWTFVLRNTAKNFGQSNIHANCQYYIKFIIWRFGEIVVLSDKIRKSSKYPVGLFWVKRGLKISDLI